VRTEIVDDADPARELPPAGPSQLFDIDADPAEAHDLAAANPARVSRMEDELARWFEDVESDRLSIAVTRT
jgi:hypothetical protein